MALSDLELGKMLAHVDQCNASINNLKVSVSDLQIKISKLDATLSRGRGILFGIIAAAGAIGSSLGISWAKLFGGN